MEENKDIEVEKTKEVNIENLKENNAPVTESTQEYEVEDTKKISEPVTTNNSDQKKEKNNKKLYIILGTVAIIIVLIIIILIVILPKKSTENSEVDKNQSEKKAKKGSQFVETINKSLENGDLEKEINKALNDCNVETKSLSLLSIDIDSDDKEELIAYIEGNNKKYLLQFKVTDEVSYEDSFQLDSKDSFGYTYSIENDKNYWYTIYSGNYTIIEPQKKVIKEEIYLDNYFTIATVYKNTPILNNGVEYDLVTKFDAEEIEKDKITEKILLDDNKITKSEIKPAAEKYIKDKQDAIDKAKKEEEEKKKAEEEAAKKEEESRFKLEGKTLHYGKYTQDPAVIIGYVIINSNGSGEIDGNSCTWKFGKHDFAQDSSEKQEKDSVNFTCTDGDYHFTAFEDDKLGNGGEIDLKLEK